MASRAWQRIAIGLAAAASIATSKLPDGWNVSAGFAADPIVVETPGSKVTYAIHVDIDGPGPYTDFTGDLTANVSTRVLAATSLDAPVQLRATLSSTTNPDLAEIQDFTLPGTMQIAPTLAAWTHCATPPCSEDFELTLELITTTSAPIELTTNIGIAAAGANYDLERTTTVMIDVSTLP